MPEIPRKITDLSNKIKDGTEKTVYIHPNKPEKVLKIDHQEIIKKDEDKESKIRNLKAEFYLTKILHFLFPTNIPDIHFIDYVELPNTDDQGFLREIIQNSKKQNLPKNLDRIIGIVNKKKYAKKITVHSLITTNNIPCVFPTESESFKKLQTLLDPSGLDITDKGIQQNVLIDTEGNYVYVDSVFPWHKKIEYDETTYTYLNNLIFPTFNIELLKKEVAGLPEEKRVSATQYIIRLEDLLEKEKNYVEKNN